MQLIQTHLDRRSNRQDGDKTFAFQCHLDLPVELSSDWGSRAEQDMTDRVFGWLGIKDGVGFAFGENRCRWVEPKRRRDGDRLPR